MTIRKACALLLIAAFALAAVPVTAQQSFAPNTVWGQVPGGLADKVASAVLVDANGNVVATAQIVNGQFEFPNVTPGDYTVQIKDADGKVLATSVKAQLQTGGTLKVLFTGNAVVGAAPAGGGVPTGLIVAGGAVAIGVGTAIVLSQDDKDKDKPPKSPKK